MTSSGTPRRVARTGGRLFTRFGQEVSSAGLPPGPGDERPVTEAELSNLPLAAQRYMRFMGVTDRPRDWSFRAHFIGRFRLNPRVGWMPAEAWQYNSAIVLGRVFVMRIRFAHLVPMVGVDTYLNGHGRMLGKLLRVVTVADGKGDEFDIGELTTYLNDAVLLAPTFLLRPAVTWPEVDDDSFDVTLNDAGRSVTGRVFLDERGAPLDFNSTDRFAAVPGGLVRAEWHTPVSEWTTQGGRVWPGPFSAVWHLPDGQLPYIEGRLEPAGVSFNSAPGV
jgi:hypothetical protein